MSYMGYYFYPDAMDSLKDDPDDEQKWRARRTRALSIAAGSGHGFHLKVRRRHLFDHHDH